MNHETGNYGTEHFGRLKRVLLHRPEESLKLITEDNREFFLFDSLPDVDRYLEEHSRYEALLRTNGVDVQMLVHHVRRNTDLLNKLPNLAYLHDTAVVSSHGALLSKMSGMARRHEEIVVREALESLGIPILYEPPEGDAFEGCLMISPTTLFIADTERHDKRAIERFIGFMLQYFEDVLYAIIPQERRFMHPDMVLNRMNSRLLVYYPPAFLQTWHVTVRERAEVNIKGFLNARGFDMIALTDREQQRWGSSFVPLEPGVIINYDISLEEKTVALLEREGVSFLHFHPDALLAGGGSLRCLTLRVLRE